MKKNFKKMLVMIIAVLFIAIQFPTMSYATENTKEVNPKQITQEEADIINDLKNTLKSNCTNYQNSLDGYELVSIEPKFYKVTNDLTKRSEDNLEITEVSAAQFNLAKIENERKKFTREIPGFEYPDVNGYGCTQYIDDYMVLVTEVFRSLIDKNEFQNYVSYSWLKTPFWNLTDLLSTSVSNNMIIASDSARYPVSESLYFDDNGNQIGKPIANTIEFAPHSNGIAVTVPSPSLVYNGGASSGYLMCYPSFNTKTGNQDGQIVTQYVHYKIKLGDLSWDGGMPSIGLSSDVKKYQAVAPLYNYKDFNYTNTRP